MRAAVGIATGLVALLMMTAGATAAPDAWNITVLETYFWRDWMPIVSHPGPDGGSPLRVRIRLWLDNKGGGARKLSCTAAVVDENGKSWRIAPRPASVALAAGEGREFEVAAADGPYLPAGTSVHVEMTWTDQNGESRLVTTPAGSIRRTD